MANPEHVALLKQGVERWNQWRMEERSVKPDLIEGDLRGTDLSEVDLTYASLTYANLSGARLTRADLAMADLPGANLREADLRYSNLMLADLTGAHLNGAHLNEAHLSNARLTGAHLTGAHLNGADLRGASLSDADLTRADLSGAILICTDLSGADLTGAKIFGISVWDVSLEGAIQKNLFIENRMVGEPPITLDDLEVAQFIYLLLKNKRVRKIIDTITSKVVLILGSFTLERGAILDALREELRRRDYLPVLFDFPPPSHRDMTETVSTLAHMARFVIADITDPSCVPHELMAVVPALPSVPVQAILLASERKYAMFDDLRRRCPWVLEPVLYEDQDQLLAVLTEQVIEPAETKAKERTRVASAP